MTKNFSLAELTRTSSKLNNTPTEEQKCNLRVLAIKILQPARDFLGIPITINSGFRSAAVNKAVGGARNSQHASGEAADLTTGTKAGNIRLYNYIRDNLEFDQLIDEYNFRWIHVSYTLRKVNRKQEICIK